MKKLIFILLLLLISCGGSYQKAEMATSDSDSIFLLLQSDSIAADKEILLSTLAIDSPIIQSETLSVQKDTIKKPSTRKMVQTKLDTTSNLPQIRKNMEVIDYQQKQLDTLLKRKK